MSNTSVNASDVSNSVAAPVEVVGALAQSDVERGLAAFTTVAGTLMPFLPAAAQKVVTTIIAISSQPWFVTLIVTASGLMDKGQHAQAQALMSCPPPAPAN